MKVLAVLVFCSFLTKATCQPHADTGIITRSTQSPPVYSTLMGHTVTFTELLNAMEKAKGWTIFKDIRVKFDHSIDKQPGGMDYAWLYGGSQFKFQAEHIGLYNVDFDEEFWWVLRNAVFDCKLSLVNCSNVKLIFDSCTFTSAVRLHANQFDFADFLGCTFQGGFRFTRGEVIDHLNFSKCNFSYLDKNIGTGGGFDMDDRLFLFSNKIDGVDLTIDSCVFVTNKKLQTQKATIDLSGSKFKNLSISHSNSNAALNIENAVIENLLNIENNRIEAGIVFKGVGFNPNNTFIDWGVFKEGRLLIFDKPKTKLLNKDSTTYLFANKALYDQLIGSYTFIFNAYKAEGNRDHANSCYIEWKDLETEYIRYNGDHFLYLINKFLKAFCNYGTSITKPLLFSFYVIILFSVLYFFVFLSHPATLAILRSQARFILDFYNKVQLNEKFVIRSIISQHEKEKKALLKYARENRYEVSYLVRMLIFNINFTNYKNKLIEKIFFVLQSTRKSKFNRATFNIPFQVSVWSIKLAFFFTIFFQLFLEAFFLSLNAFTTLGFGEFKVSGRLIYITIIQGFVGWLLLSIFTVALINQIINW